MSVHLEAGNVFPWLEVLLPDGIVLFRNVVVGPWTLNDVMNGGLLM